MADPASAAGAAPSAAGPPASSRPVVLAAITGAHGVGGEVRIKLFGDGFAGVKRHKAFLLNGDPARVLAVSALRDDGKGGAIARFAGVADRNAAEALRGVTLAVPRDALPPLAPGEYYHADLIGLPAVSAGGEVLGVVVAVENFGAGDVVEIERAPGAAGGAAAGEGGAAVGRAARFMVPMLPAAVPAWDDARLVVADGWAE